MPATTCAFVTTTSGAAIQPLPSIPRPHAYPVILTTLSAARTTSGSRASFELGGATVAGGPSEDVQRVDPLERLEQALRREVLVDAGQDLGLLHGAPQVGLAREVEQHGAERPAEHDPRRGAEEAPASVSRSRSPGTRPRVERSVTPSISAAPDSNEPREPRRRARRAARTATPRSAATARPAPRRTRRARSPRARARLARARARSRRAHSAPRPRARTSRRSPPGKRTSRARRYLPAAPLDWPSPGGVVQLVRTPACHAGGRGFESRRSRLLKSLQIRQRSQLPASR